MAFFELPTMMAFSALTMWTSSPSMARLAACVAMRPRTRPVASMTVTARLASGSSESFALKCLAPDMWSPDDPAVLALREGLHGLPLRQDPAAPGLGAGRGARAGGRDGELLRRRARPEQFAGDDGGLAVAEVGVDLAEVDLCPVARRLLQTGSDVSPQGSLVLAAGGLEGTDELHEHRIRLAVGSGCHGV